MKRAPFVVYWKKSREHLPSFCDAFTVEEAKKIREEKRQAGFLVEIKVV